MFKSKIGVGSKIMDTQEISFEASVLLGKAEITMADYQELQVGDVVILDQKIENSLIVQVGFTHFLLATPGLIETHKAIMVDGTILTR